MSEPTVSFRLKALAVAFIIAISFLRGLRKICPKSK